MPTPRVKSKPRPARRAVKPKVVPSGIDRFWRLTADAVPALVAYIGTDYRYRMANDRYQDWLGVNPDQMPGRHVRDVVGPAAWRIIRPYFDRVRAGEAVVYESEIAYAGTAPRWMQMTYTPDRDATGKIVGFAVLAMDITARKQAEAQVVQQLEQSLQLSEREFYFLAENMPQIVWATRPDGWNIYFNQRWVSYTGLTLAESYGHGWNTPFHPDDKQRAWVAWQRATHHNERYSLECRLRRYDGVYRWWLIRGAPMLGAHGEILKWFGTCTDIEDLKNIEAVLEQRVAERTAALRTNERLLQEVMDGCTCPVFLKDLDGRFLRINAALEKMLGQSQANLLGKTDYDIAPRELADYWRAHDKKVLVTGQAITIEEQADLPDGHHDFLANKFPLVDAQGKTYGVGSISLDITDRKQAEEQIKASLAEKEILMREIHHRVKNNLQVISSLVSLQANTQTDSLPLAAFDDLHGRISSMALVHEKLYQTGDVRRLNFADYAESLLRSLWRTYGVMAEKVRLELALAPLMLPLETAVPCGLIMNELASNALKYAFPHDHSGHVTVSMELEPASGVVCLRVRDNGVGLPAGLDWRQAHSLGLRLVSMLAAQLRGTVETGPGPGTEFRICFPAPDKDSNGAPA